MRATYDIFHIFWLSGYGVKLDHSDPVGKLWFEREIIEDYCYPIRIFL